MNKNHEEQKALKRAKRIEKKQIEHAEKQKNFRNSACLMRWGFSFEKISDFYSFGNSPDNWDWEAYMKWENEVFGKWDEENPYPV